MNHVDQVRAVLIQRFDARHVDAALKHFSAAVEKYVLEDSEGVLVRAGKFVEAVTKALMLHCGKTISNPRRFSAGSELRQLEQAAASFSDVIRLVIPRACIFAYDVTSNRGGRHDAHDIDANVMDASVVMPIMSWVLAEMVRFSSGNSDTDAATALIEELTNKTYPYFEEIDGRPYVNIDGLKPGEVALLLLYSSYPKRISRQTLVDLVRRHGHTDSAATTAVHRLKNLVDDQDGDWKLRGIGRQRGEALLKEVPRRN